MIWRNGYEDPGTKRHGYRGGNFLTRLYFRDLPKRAGATPAGLRLTRFAALTARSKATGNFIGKSFPLSLPKARHALDHGRVSANSTNFSPVSFTQFPQCMCLASVQLRGAWPGSSISLLTVPVKTKLPTAIASDQRAARTVSLP